MILQDVLSIKTPGRSLTNITRQIQELVSQSKISQGICNVFLQHTSASLIISENSDIDVCDDLERFFARLIPDGDTIFKHDAEGDDDMSAHVRSILTQSSLSIPITNKVLNLGTWQGIFLWEHRYQGYQRKIVVTVIG